MPVLSEHDLDRVRSAVEWVERQVRLATAQRGRSAPASPQVQLVRVTSAVLDDGRYPGKVLAHDAEAGTYTDLGDVWVVGANGAALVTGRYPARRSGPADGSGSIRPVFVVDDVLTSGEFTFRGIQYLTASSGTYTPTAGTTALLVELIGGGGGGGAANVSDDAAQGSVGGGGAAGTYTAKFYSSVAASYTYAVGAGGAGATGTGAGTTGSATTFDSGNVTAPGGAGGSSGGTGATSQTTNGGAHSSAGVNGDVSLPGQAGFAGWVIEAVGLGLGGVGGSTILGAGGRTTVSGVPSTGQGHGAGGGGGMIAGLGSGIPSVVNGGAGGAGLIRVWEFGSTSLPPATQAEMEAATSVAVGVTPGRTQYHPGVAKGWVKFDSTGAIDASYNVTSITDNGTGDWTVNWGTDFSSANYAVVAMAKRTSASGSSQCAVVVDKDTSPTAGATRLFLLDFGDVKRDMDDLYCAAYGDQ